MSDPNVPRQPIGGGTPPATSSTGPAKKPWSDFRKGLVVTAIPFLVYALLFFVLGPVQLGQPLMFLFLFFPFVAIPAAIILSIAFAVRGSKRLAAGILAGLGIGIVAIGASCFAFILNRR